MWKTDPKRVEKNALSQKILAMQAAEKNRLRVEYAKSQSFKLDAGLFFETIKGVFKKADDMRKENK